MVLYNTLPNFKCGTFLEAHTNELELYAAYPPNEFKTILDQGGTEFLIAFRTVPPPTFENGIALNKNAQTRIYC